MSQPNIIFIILDTLRGDRVLNNHEDENLTPFIKKLMSNSFFFKNCIANSPWTFPSHISMFTGLDHSQSTLISRDIEKLSNKVPLITEILKNFGYFTMCFTENPFISKIDGLTKGFNLVFKNYKDPAGWFIKRKRILSFFNKIEKFIEKRIQIRALIRLWKTISLYLDSMLAKIKIDYSLKSYFFNFKNNSITQLEKFIKLIKKNQKKKTLLYLF